MKSQNTLKRRVFTLIEVLIAVIILVMMMTMMLYIVSVAQKSFKLQEAKTAMFQKSRMIFDLIERDVRSLVTDKREDKEVGYYVFDHDPSDLTKTSMVTLVSSGDPDDKARSRLTEITYAFHNSSTDLNDRFLIKRQLVTEAHGEDWNFCGAPLDWASNDSISSPDFETVIGGVANFNVTFQEGGGTTAATGSHSSQPIRVVVNLELFDESLSGLEFELTRSRHTRGFTKVFYIGHIHSR